MTDSGLIPLPDDAIELESEGSIRSDLFKSPLRLAFDPDGDLWVASGNNLALCRFDQEGRFLGRLDEARKGRGVLRGPLDIAVTGDKVFAYEMGRKRLVALDSEGSLKMIRRVSDIDDFDIDAEGNLVTAPRVVDKDSPLIRVHMTNSRSIAFGKPLSFIHSLTGLNSRSLAVNEKSEVFVAFRYFPLVRKYSPEGVLLAEIRIDSPVMEAKERYNLRAIGEGIADIAQRAVYKPLIVDIEVVGGRIYLLSHNPRLEITELNDEGEREATYWIDTREIYISNDLAVRRVDGDIRFYVARNAPPSYDVDALKAKRPQPSGLEGEIERLTAEIAIYPSNDLAFNNRGAAKHRMGDYRGALEDFARAIELAPLSVVAYNNRGLSRVKIGDLEGAVADFSRAIELGPEVAAVYFNRGIARAHRKEFAKAIEDFETAMKRDLAFASRAQEQIDYCRARLKLFTAPSGPGST